MVGLSAKSSRGFTLVELMIVIALIAILAMAASPFTSEWSNSAQRQAAKNNLVMAYGQAKAAAIRNDCSTAIQLEFGTSIAVKCGTDTLWQANTPTGVSITLSSGASPLSFDNRGLPVGNANISFVITKGAQDNGVLL
ncbi:prepilin-type N-terminal cleavage/methylation domain-containing protein [Pseudomonas wenzhouensis]|nr:prepilin-type N-terminal cleavage/methylation domain-containing protein [Pseudomonas wenzhouensis]MDM9650224.1 prepilin-type N-terminal cleavage/methylation domain-containing protein [Pseudomonas wenzhouensis]